MTAAAAPPPTATPLEVRHALENFLTAYTSAVDDGDVQTVVHLLSGTAVSFDGSPPLTSDEDKIAAYSRAINRRPRTRHLVCTGQVIYKPGGPGGTARYPYQRWSAADGVLAISAIGYYLLRFDVTGPGVNLSRLDVVRT